MYAIAGAFQAFEQTLNRIGVQINEVKTVYCTWKPQETQSKKRKPSKMVNQKFARLRTI